MTRAKDVDVRRPWIADVRRSTEIGDACRVLLLTMAAEGMTQKGYVSIPRAKLAALLDRHPQRITERIAEAIKAGFLVRVGKAYEGTTATYAASFPGTRANGGAVTSSPPECPSANGSAVTSERLPPQDHQAGETDREVTAEQLPNTRACARATNQDREQEPAPDGSRANGDHRADSKTCSDEEWQPTSDNPSSSSVPRRRVA